MIMIMIIIIIIMYYVLLENKLKLYLRKYIMMNVIKICFW